MELTLGIYFYFKLYSTFNITLLLPVSNHCFCLGIILKLSSRWLLPCHWHWLIRGVATSVFMYFDTNLHAISSINGLHHIVATPHCGSFYLQSWLSILALLTLGSLSSMIFTPPNIVLLLFISSFICHLLSTGILIDSNLMPPDPKFRKFDLLPDFYNWLDDVIYNLQSYPGKDRNIMSVKDPSPEGDDHFLIFFPAHLSCTYYFIASSWRSH